MKRSIVKVLTGATAMAGKRKAKATGARAGDYVEIRNRDATLRIEKATGFIRGCTWNGTGTDLFQQTRDGIPGYLGGLRIYDERDDRWYDDARTPFTISTFSKRGQAVTLTRQYRGAPFTVTLTLRMDEDAFHWEVAAEKKNKKVADRSLRVYFMFPLIAGWDVWAPCNWGEKLFDGMTPFEFMYTQIPYVSEQEIILPMVSHFSRRLGVGYSMVEPIDANVPAAKFGFNNMERCYNWGSMLKDARTAPVLEAVNYYIGLVGDRPMKTKVMLFFHEGDWRPGLGMVYRRWQEFFDAFNDAIYDRNGVFQCGGIEDADHVDKMLAMGIKTLEVHGHFEDYCDYAVAGRDEWWRIAVKEELRRALLKEAGNSPELRDTATGRLLAERTDLAVNAFLDSHTEEEVRAKLVEQLGDGWRTQPLKRHREDVRRRLQCLADAGISCHWYFNYTDGYRVRVEAEWPDSISRDERGNPIPSGWYMSHNMNADPRWSFGRFTLESARKIFESYPMLDGLFLDCFRHYEIDFAHDDGVTVVNGKPCYSMNHSYDEIERRIKTQIMKPRNLTSFANKPMSIRSMRYCDGQLLEGNGDMYEEKFFWASIASPLYFMWTREDAPLDEFLRRAVLHGCYPRNDRYEDGIIAQYRRYLPLFAAFSRRVLCFEPDPLRVPDGSRGKLYTLPDGSYIAGIVNLHFFDRDRVVWGKTPYALFRVARGHDVESVGVLHPGDGDWRSAKFKFDGTFIAVPLPEYVNCAVVKLFVKGKSGKAIGPDRFHQRERMCGDPESSFEDISER
jgi:hypothetical protein